MVNGVTPDPMQADQLRRMTDAMSADSLQARKVDAPKFEEMLTKLIEDVDNKQKQADVSIKQLASGEETSIQDVVMKLEEADMTFHLMKEIRDKLVAAYKEVMSMSS